MSKYNTFVILISIFVSLTGCKEFRNDEDIKKQELKNLEYVAKAKGYNFLNLDIKGLKPGVSRQKVDSFMNENTSKSDERISGKYFNTNTFSSERLAFYKADKSAKETVIAGITGLDKNDTAYFITRMKEYTYKTGPEINEFSNSLFKKYGPPTVITTRWPRTRYQKYGAYLPYFGKESDVKAVYRYYWLFDNDGNLKPRQVLSWTKKRDFFDNIEHVESPEAPIKEVFNRYYVSKCLDNCGFGISALVVDEYYKDRKARIVNSYNITISDLSILKSSMNKAELTRKSEEEIRIRRDKEKNKQVDL